MAALRARVLVGVARRVALASLTGSKTGVPSLLPFSGVRAASDLPRRFLPGSFPTTEAERAAAAKKYGMTPEDYKPYPDEGFGFGDYPMLPNKSQEERDPWYKWDHPDFRRNWGEPIHWDFDMYIRTRVDTSPTTVPFNFMLKVFFGFLAAMGILFYLGYKFPSYPPISPKQYPYNNLYLERGGDPDKMPPEVKHYEFK